MSQQGTPRKFSEKIAILERKQNEEQEQFHSVMRDVRAITNKTPASPGASYPSPNDPMQMQQQQQQQNSGMPESPGVCSPLHLSTGAAHPLSMAWNRPGGSLPNVHQMVQQQQQPVNDYTNWNYWQVPQAQGHHVRTRSPGSSHAGYHPYINNRGPKQNERIPPLENHMMNQNVQMHLQPPDNSWSKARSDPTIHMNAIAAASAAANYGYPTPTGVAQWTPPDYRMQNGGQNPGPSSHPPAYALPTYPTGAGGGPPFALQNMQQQQGGYGGMQQQQQQQMHQNHHPQLQAHQSLASPSGCGGSISDMSVGSLPNMHSSLVNQSQMNFGGGGGGQSPNQHQQQQQQQQQMSNSSMNPHIQQLSTQFCQQLTTPSMEGAQSQSAPTSPAQGMENIMHQRWPPTRHFSASPDTLDIPNIVLTGADGTLDCFQDLQDLHLDNEIQQLLSNPNEQSLDPGVFI